MIHSLHFPSLEELQRLKKLDPKLYQDHDFPRRQGIFHQGCKIHNQARQSAKQDIKNNRADPFSFKLADSGISILIYPALVVYLKDKSFTEAWASDSFRMISRLGHLKTLKLPFCTVPNLSII